MQIKYTFLIVCLLAAIGAYGQKDTSKKLTPFVYIDQMPIAGYDYNDYLNKHIFYPDSARKKNIQGRVKVKFVVNEDGHISDCAVVQSSGNIELDNEALRVVGTFPNWKPGKMKGKPVKVYFTLPIVFTL